MSIKNDKHVESTESVEWWERWSDRWESRRTQNPQSQTSGWTPGWHRKRRSFVRGFIRYFLFMMLVILGSMALVSWSVTTLFGGTGQMALMVWAASCSLTLLFPLIMMATAMRLYQRFASPLASVMAAADSLANGDLSVRITEKVSSRASGELRRLTTSFNHMAEELERTDQQRRNLTADVAHELRTPLHIIQGNLEGILDGVYEPTDEHITATLDETRALARLVNDLRTLSLAETGQLPMEIEALELNELLEDLHTSFSGQAEAADIDLHINNSDEDLWIMGDAGRLDQVVSNLVVNALRHTPAGGTITITAKQTTKHVKLIVSDTGEGIPADDLPYIFDRFWRGDRARTHASGVGGGLGLAIARQLVQACHGTIAVESAVGAGTTFTIALPRVTQLAHKDEYPIDA
ncbi:MAG: HAMP domain-containing sensor histidine kinase [Chloroflexota bacterium]